MTVPANDNAKIMAYKSAPGGVLAYLTRIEATAKSIANKDPEDARVPAIVQSIRQLLATVEALQPVRDEAEDIEELKRVDDGISRTKARLAIALTIMKQRGLR